MYTMILKRRNSWPPDVSALDALNDYTWQRQLAEKVVLNPLYFKQITNIIKYWFYTNASKNNRWLKVAISEWFVRNLIDYFTIRYDTRWRKCHIYKPLKRSLYGLCLSRKMEKSLRENCIMCCRLRFSPKNVHKNVAFCSKLFIINPQNVYALKR